MSASLPPLAALPTGPACARNLIKLTLTDWNLHPLIEPASLIISELVTNAIQASTTLQPIRIVLLSDTTRLVMEVWDLAPGIPVQHDTDDLEEFGRGLTLVAALATTWGWHPPARQGHAKCVWAELTTLIDAPLR